VLEAYSHTRVERPDANLLVRARLVAELGLLSTLMVALTRKDAGAVEVLTTQLRRLDDAVHPPSEEPDDYRRTSLAPVGPRRRTAQPPALVVDNDDEDLPEVAEELTTDPADAADAAGATDGADAADAAGATDGADAADDGTAAGGPEAVAAGDDAEATDTTAQSGPAEPVDEADQVTTEIDLRDELPPELR
jgi:macrolide phosphotransferase